MENSPESLQQDDEISRGRLLKVGKNSYARKSFDIMSAFPDLLGKKVSEIPQNPHDAAWVGAHPRSTRSS